MGHVVTAGYVTVETAVGPGRAHVDIPRGALLPDDVPGEQITTLLSHGHIQAVGGDQEAEADSGAGQRDGGGDPGASDGPSAQEIRDWARQQGLEVSDKGRVPAAVVDAYNAAHPPQQ